jgi:predicted acetyltransferase
MTKLELIPPDLAYQESFLAAVQEYQAEDLPNYRQLDIEQLRSDFSSYVEQIKNEAKGINLPEGHVPHTLLWLVDGDEYIGRVDIRHELNDFLQREGGHIGYDVRPSKRRQGYGKVALELGLQKAAELGLNEVLVTCDVTNVGSNKIIQGNGGRLENTVPVMDSTQPDKNRYWISLPTATAPTSTPTTG